MAEYIEREAVINVVANNPYNVAFKTSKTIQEIENLPSADVVEVKHGYWIKSIHKETPIIKDGRFFEKEHEVFCCSVCDVKIVGLKDMSFCPFCGAKMDGERKCDNG